MIRRPNSLCSDCRELAVWGINWTPRHCEDHKTDDDTNLVERPCISCGLPNILDDLNHCECCTPAAFATARLAKQNALMNYLDLRDLHGNSTDKIIDDGTCGAERPDRVFDFGDKIVILECDEHQHKERQCLCEQTRMVNLGQTFGGTSVLFIRWNPDKYKPADPASPQEPLSHRHKLCGDLISNIRDRTNTPPTATLVSAIYLYFNGWSSLSDEPWHAITPIHTAP